MAYLKTINCGNVSIALVTGGDHEKHEKTQKVGMIYHEKHERHENGERRIYHKNLKSWEQLSEFSTQNSKLKNSFFWEK